MPPQVGIGHFCCYGEPCSSVAVALACIQTSFTISLIFKNKTRMKQKNISILALLLMAVTGAWAQGSGGDDWGPVQTSSAAWTALTEGSTTGMTLGAATLPRIIT